MKNNSKCDYAEIWCEEYLKKYNKEGTLTKFRVVGNFLDTDIQHGDLAIIDSSYSNSQDLLPGHLYLTEHIGIASLMLASLSDEGNDFYLKDSTGLVRIKYSSDEFIKKTP